MCARATGGSRLLPRDMQQRWIEITGPTDRKLVINALNSGADGFMADFEDANAPTWRNMVEGHINLRDAIDRTITYDGSDGRHYELVDDPATLLVRPRGWHLPERHLLLDGEPIAGALMDFGLYFFHCAPRLLANGSGPYFYLPKLESHLEARLWNDVFCLAQDALGVAAGDDQGHGADRDAAGGVRDGRDPLRAPRALGGSERRPLGLHLLGDQMLPGPARDGAARPRRGDDDRSVHAGLHGAARGHDCHRRGAHAMGGMAALIPSRKDEAANAKALEGVRADKEREVEQGYDGSWVAHPDLVPVAREVFERGLGGRAQPARAPA